MKKRTHPITKSLAVAGLIVNILVPPTGIGSIICGRINAGLGQIILSLLGYVMIPLGIILSLALIGIPILIFGLIFIFSAWVWGIYTTIDVIAN